jgi:hypothetical protein
LHLPARVSVGIACAAIALQPAIALALPSPSPALDGVLASPPTADYVEASSSVPGSFEGAFDPKTFVTNTGAKNADAVETTLQRGGFVDGYWRTWVQKTTRHVLVEIVIAFSGRDGADKWLRSSELADKSDSNYQHSLSIGGIDAYYGAHFLYASNQSYADAFAFVKGNDFFIVLAVSPKDDLGSLASIQTLAQYSAAPDATIPQSQWPQSSSSIAAFNAGSFLGGAILLVLLAGVVLFVLGLARRSRRQASFASALPGAMSGSGVQLSPDGRYWWDGQSWRDAQVEVPPTAQRSLDGHFWWDGRQWRPVA